MRILRIFKLVRHFAGLQSLFYTLQQAYQVEETTFSASEAKFKTILWQELGLLVLVVLVAILTYSSLVYFIQTTQYIFMVFLISNLFFEIFFSATSYYLTQSFISVIIFPLQHIPSIPIHLPTAGLLCRKRITNITRRPQCSQLYRMG